MIVCEECSHCVDLKKSTKRPVQLQQEEILLQMARWINSPRDGEDDMHANEETAKFA